MDKLQYDSFYKFLVSLGIVLITLPALAFLYLLNTDYELISQVDYDNLSEISIQRLHNNEELLNLTTSILPIISIVFTVIGLILIIIGCCKWYRIQKELDEQIKSDTITKRINATQLSSSETVEKAANEICSEQNASTSVSSDRVVKYMQIEDKCYKLFSNRFSHKYILKQNLRIGKFEYDIVALSKHKKNDIIFEIKYWTVKTITDARLENLISNVKYMCENYKFITNHNCESVIVIVAPREKIENVKSSCSNHFQNYKDSILENVTFEFYAEEDL
ncbi:MAG: hypothetical protein IJ419_15985 [Agathobacter sp.]|nr:hypothetical protein [Agathobacter sp.]